MESTIFLLVMVVGLYLTPGILASIRHHPKEVSIWLFSLAFGWTIIGWGIAVLWASSNPQRVSVESGSETSLADEIDRLAKMRAEGLIDENEYAAMKRKTIGS